MKRLLPAAVVAVGIHVLLFSIQVPWTLPGLLMPQSRSVTIQLVEASVADRPETRSRTPKKPHPRPKAEPVKAPAPLPEANLQPTDISPPSPTPSSRIEDLDGMEALLDDPSQSAATPLEEVPDQHPGAFIESAKPRYDFNPSPVYPTVARRRGYEGTVVLEVLVTRQGRAEHIHIVQSSGHRILDERAVGTVQTWRFTPALRGGEPVAMKVKVPIAFRLHGS